MRFWSRTLTLKWLLAPLLVLVTACGTGETQDNVDITNSGPGVSVAVPTFAPLSSLTPVGSRTAAAGAATLPAGGRTETLIARDNVFDRTTMTIPSGTPVQLTLRNQGSALHNWHALVRDSNGEEPKTALIPGNQQSIIVFTINQRGTFDYLCDVHPVEMRGKITIQ